MTGWDKHLLIYLCVTLLLHLPMRCNWWCLLWHISQSFYCDWLVLIGRTIEHLAGLSILLAGHQPDGKPWYVPSCTSLVYLTVCPCWFPARLYPMICTVASYLLSLLVSSQDINHDMSYSILPVAMMISSQVIPHDMYYSILPVVLAGLQQGYTPWYVLEHLSGLFCLLFHQLLSRICKVHVYN